MPSSKVPFSIGRSGPHNSFLWSLNPHESADNPPNDILIGSAVSAELTRVLNTRNTDRQTTLLATSAEIGHIDGLHAGDAA